ncbi:hypothetical protein MMC22_007649 [Lobaria immixta]|nr:hypothetical protein [Lobaria immixta]
MNELVGHAPLLLGAFVGQNNASAAPGGGERGPPPTLVLHNQIAEADYLRTLLKTRYEANHSPITGVTLGRAVQKPQLQGLTKVQRHSFNTNGYLVLSNILAGDEATALLEEARDVMRAISTGGEGVIRHVLSDTMERPSPIGRVLATFETAGTPGSENTPRPIARLGCGVHRLMPAFRTLTHSSFHRSIAASLGYGSPRVTQSQLVAKSAGVGGEIVAHQDSCVSFTNPPSGLTFWYALEDATVANGCLSVAPGSHLTEPIRERMVQGDRGIPRFEPLNTPLWARETAYHPITGTEVEHEYVYEPLEVKQGSLVLFHGNLLHRSGRNASAKSRMAYTFSIVDGDLESPDDCYMKPMHIL